MALPLLSMLALAQGAFAVFDGFVEIVHTTDVVVPFHLDNAFVPMAAQAGAASAPECTPAVNKLAACNDAGLLGTDVPYSSFIGCLCCSSGTAMLSAYSTCASYILNSATGPVVTTVGSGMATFYTACSREGTGICGPAITSSTTLVTDFSRTTTIATTSRRPITTSAPRGCTSMASIVNSCSLKLGASTSRVSDRDAAECLCYDNFGNYNTALGDYARSCAPFARTSATVDYTLISKLQTFCEDYSPVTSSRRSAAATGGASDGIVFTPVLSSSGDGLTAISTGGQNSTPKPTGSQTSDNAAPRPSSARGWARPGLHWVAVCVTFVVSVSMLA